MRLKFGSAALVLVILCGPVHAFAAPATVTNLLAQVSPGESASKATLSPWAPLFHGVEVCEGAGAQPRPVQVRALRVDLHEPMIGFLVTPSNGDAPLEVDARTTSDFLKQFKCQAAINGSVFAPFAKSNLAPMNIEGFAVSQGEVYSEANQYHSLVISTNHRAWIARTAAEGVGGFNALSGFYSVLTHGTNTGTSKDLHPRSSVGVSREGRWLIIMVADGRQPGYSEGLSTAETGEWMRRLGAYDALNLDGGGSSALAVEAPDGQPRVLNRPCGPPVGTERRVANHLGVFARRLAD